MAAFFRKLFGDKQNAPATSEMPESIEQGMQWQAEDFVRAFSQPDAPIDGSCLDYSSASLDEVDRLLDNVHCHGQELPDDLHFLISAYVFEVARREFGGRYLRGDEKDPFVLVMGKEDASVGLCVMSKVRGRAINGNEDNIPFFYAGIAPAIDRGVPATLI
ncbi:hypothetical protein [uncultured Erythrobacter sp.]|uniref:hypothetical protein n=1 Tax=uncultured Erythrobacter sp. TaxID=263913 RepID=UPI0026119865|nr:hypothetical protein [uncultured Erythrobacter sp.]